MVLTKQEWFLKLKSWVPSHFHDKPVHDAHFYALARVLSSIQENIQSELNQAYIDYADDDYLAIHGDERSIPRLENENTNLYRLRLKNIGSKVDKNALKRIIDNILLNGEAVIYDDFDGGPFLNRSHFLNCREILFDRAYNAFTVVIDNQIPVPDVNLNRGDFLNRGEFLFGGETTENLYSLLIEAINHFKALGTMYRLIERSGGI